MLPPPGIIVRIAAKLDGLPTAADAIAFGEAVKAVAVLDWEAASVGAALHPGGC